MAGPSFGSPFGSPFQRGSDAIRHGPSSAFPKARVLFGGLGRDGLYQCGCWVVDTFWVLSFFFHDRMSSRDVISMGL